MQEIMLTRIAELLNLEVNTALLGFLALVAVLALSGNLRAALVLAFAGVLLMGNGFLVQQYNLNIVPSTYVITSIVMSAAVLIAIIYNWLQDA